ncbi:MAG TPA: CoA transferase [Dehalococcoidia bacterium]|nr:CoA transferase [Dehalococcoidia bacterium]
MADPSGPLTGYRVLELCETPAGAACGRLLALYGAEVIKVEPPGRGDRTRWAGPFAGGDPHPETGALHLFLNAGKRSLSLRWETKTGARLALALAEYADAVVTDLAPARARRAGLTEDAFLEANPRAVVTSVTAYGRTGPWANRRWSNFTAFAAGGQHYITGDPDRRPIATAGLQAEYQAGLHAFGATVAGLFATMRFEIGQIAEVSAQEVQAAVLEAFLPDYAYRGALPLTKRRGNHVSAVIGIYPAKDGYIGIHCMQKNFPQLAKAMNAEWMLEDERFKDNRARLSHDDELMAQFYAWASSVTKREAYRIAGETRAPVSPVNTIEDLLQDEHLAARGFFEEIEHPDAGRLRYPGPPARFSATPGSVRPAPRLGADTAAVLREVLGMSPAQIALLRQQGVV